MRYEVQLKKRLSKQVRELPEPVQATLEDLLRDLRDKGPWQPSWPNYSKLGANRYHCHLNYSHVACWMHDKNTILIEVYYVGSRQGAPY